MNVWDLLISAKDTKEEEDEQDIRKACIWLKEAGFPQYVQMFNDSEFPISLKLVQEDHMDFDGGSLMALFRRIEILNKASEIKSALLTEDISSKITDSIPSFQKPYYEIIEDSSENEVENENEESDDEDDDKENVLEQTALSSNWSYEPRTRRWSHIELSKPPIVIKQDQNIPKLENYLGVSYPRPFVSIPEDNSSDNYQKPYQFRRPNCFPDSHRSFEPIIESNPENNDSMLKDNNDSLDHLMASLQLKNKSPKSPISPNDNQNSTALQATSPDSNRDSLKVDKPNNHILRSASMRLMKAVSRINPNQLSLRHKKDHVLTSPKPTNDDDFSNIKVPTSNEEMDFAKLKLPDKPNEFPRESYPIGDSGWLNGRTGSFISRNNGQPDAEFKTSKKNIIYDLDPVISLLESDVNSLEVMRSRIKSRASPDSAPTSPILRHKSTKQILKKDQQRLSDFESYTRYNNKDGSTNFTENIDSDTRISSPSVIDQSVLKEDEKDWALSSKINRNNVTRWSHTSYSKDKSIPQYHHLLELSVTKFNLLKKFSILSCTSMLEKYCPQKNVFNWRIPRLLPQKQKLSLENTNFIFGVNLSVIQNRFGQPFPPVILNIFSYLRKHGPTTQGIFRKTGMKCRIKELKKEMEKDENLNNFDGYNVNDIADILKTFFRDLPDRLLTHKLSSTLLAIYNYVPKESQCEGLKWALFSLPDENRVALEYLIEFLSYLSKYSDDTKMDAKNLSLCFAPSLFNFQNDGSSNNTMSPLRMKKSNGPNNKHLAEQNAAHLCVVSMINNTSSLFQITHESLKMGSFNAPDKSDSNDVTHIMSTNLRQEWIRNKMLQLKNDTNANKTGWTNINKDFIKKLHGANAVIEQLSYRKIGSNHNDNDGIALRTWKVVIDIEGSPGYLFTYIKDKRYLWDPDMPQMELIKEINEYIECVKLISDNPDGSFVPRQFNVLRGHQLGVNGSAHMIFSESMSDEIFLTSSDNFGSVSNYSDVLIGHIYCDNFLIEAVSTKLTRVTWISRVDLGGHHSDWYSNHWGHNMIRRAAHLRNFAKENLSLRLSNESSINNFSDSALSPGKDHSSPSINPQIFESAPETVL